MPRWYGDINKKNPAVLINKGDGIFSGIAELAETAESSFTDYGQP